MNINIERGACSPEIACRINVPDAQPCSSIEKVVEPMLLAEQVCPNALQSAWDDLRRTPHEKSPQEMSVRLHDEGSLLLEMALASAGHDQKAAEEMFDLSMNKFDCAAWPKPGAPPNLKSGLFAAYKESFEARLHGDHPFEGLPAARKKLVAMIREPAAFGGGKFWIGHHLWEAYFDRVLLPSTPRESGKWMVTPERHMSYVIEEQEKDDSQKTAYMTDSNAPGPKVLSIAFGAWALYSVERLAPGNLQAVDEKNYSRHAGSLVIEWLCKEVDGDGLAEGEQEVLEHMFTSGYISVAQARRHQPPRPPQEKVRQPATPIRGRTGELRQNLGDAFPDHLRQ